VTLSHPEASRFIQENSVPCWEMVRAVPKVTIDFGEGRVIDRTLQGNTVMYVCLPDGRPVDAYPGVYTGPALLKGLQETMTLLQQGDGLQVNPAEVQEWHRARIAAAIDQEVRRITLSKAFVESPLLHALGISRQEASARLMPPAPNGEAAVAVAPVPPGEPVRSASVPPAPREATAREPDPVTDPHAALARLSAKIEDVSKQPATVEQLRARHVNTPGKPGLTPEEIGRKAVQLDSDANLRLVRPAVHLLFAGYTDLPELAGCRDTIYRQILRVPIDDPYLGLADALVPGSGL
jgi:hypothetical protein